MKKEAEAKNLSARIRKLAFELDPKQFSEERRGLVRIANRMVGAQDAGVGFPEMESLSPLMPPPYFSPPTEQTAPLQQPQQPQQPQRGEQPGQYDPRRQPVQTYYNVPFLNIPADDPEKLMKRLKQFVDQLNSELGTSMVSLGEPGISKANKAFTTK